MNTIHSFCQHWFGFYFTYSVFLLHFQFNFMTIRILTCCDSTIIFRMSSSQHFPPTQFIWKGSISRPPLVLRFMVHFLQPAHFALFQLKLSSWIINDNWACAVSYAFEPFHIQNLFSFCKYNLSSVAFHIISMSILTMIKIPGCMIVMCFFVPSFYLVKLFYDSEFWYLRIFRVMYMGGMGQFHSEYISVVMLID
jgi:hypothetical protein